MNPRPSPYDPWAEFSYLGPRCPKNYGPSCLGSRFYWAEWSGPSCLWAELSVIRRNVLVLVSRSYTINMSIAHRKAYMHTGTNG